MLVNAARVLRTLSLATVALALATASTWSVGTPLEDAQAKTKASTPCSPERSAKEKQSLQQGGEPASSQVELTSSSSEPNGHGLRPSLDYTGRRGAFESDASNLVENDTNGASDIFMRDRGTGDTFRVSVNTAGGQANGGVYKPSVSGDGSVVAFEAESATTNLYPSDTNGLTDVVVRDRKSGQTTAVGAGNGISYAPSASYDGRYIAFYSNASNFVSGDTNANYDIFVRDRTAGTIARASVGAGGAQGNNLSYEPSISANGRVVAFASAASNLVAGDTNGQIDVFVRNLDTQTTKRVSVGFGGMQGNGYSRDPAISPSGRYVAFSSTATNLQGTDGNGTLQDVFVYDTSRDLLLRVSNGGNSTSKTPSASDDGRVAFSSSASNLAPGDTNGQTDIIEWREGYSFIRLSFNDFVGQSNAGASNPSMSGDGTTAAFDSFATSLLVPTPPATRSRILIHVFRAATVTAALACIIGILDEIDPDFNGQDPGYDRPRPEAGLTVYRVWGGEAPPDGPSWTTTDPEVFGPDKYRVVAGLPDRLNTGESLTTGELTNPDGVTGRMSKAVGTNVAYRAYPGGLWELLIPDPVAQISNKRTIPLDPPYGGPPRD